MSTGRAFNVLLRTTLFPTVAATTCLSNGVAGAKDRKDISTAAATTTTLCEAKSTLTCEKVDMGLEENRFQVTLNKHRRHLSQYRHKWDYDVVSSRIPTASWPFDIPSDEELPALQSEMLYCKRSPNYRDDKQYCDHIAFVVGTALLRSGKSKDAAEGLAVIKDLAERGREDAMCMYGTCFSEGRGGLEPNPEQAVVWWRRCAELHEHPQALYELGVAFYTGEGVVEDEEQAAEFFERASDKGHPGASFMYGDCLLEGIGVKKDRAKALERLIWAAERGHRGARSRVIAVLEMRDEDDFGMFTDSSRQTLAAVGSKAPTTREQQQQAIIAERRYTIGGVSPPAVLARRRTIVQESRRS